MHEWVEILRNVQERDTRIARLRAQVLAVPDDKEKAQATLREAKEAVDQAKTDLQDVEKSIKKLEIQVDTIDAKQKDFQAKSLMIKDNDEYKAAMHQIETCNRQKSDLEDQELVLMEQLELAKSRLVAERKRYEAVEKRIGQLLGDLDSRMKNCQDQVDKLQAKRDEMIKDVPADAAARYERIIRSRLKMGVEPLAFAPIQEYTCASCHMNIPPQVRMNAIKGLVVACPNCSVLLYAE